MVELLVLVFIGAGAAVLSFFYGFHVGILALAYYYLGLHIHELDRQKRSPPA